MSTTPKISIIMPTFNRAGFIMESVASVLRQTYTNWELIIVDDGSEDHTAALMEQICDNRVRFYEAGKVGLGIKLKNIGIELSSGELIAFLDSDDLWADDKLEKQAAALNDHPDAGFSITGGYNFLKPGDPLEYFYKQREGMLVDNIYLLFFQSGASILPQTLMFRRECLPVIHEYIKMHPYSDVEFVLGLALAYKAVILYEPLLYRRLHANSFSTSNWEYGYREGIAVINRHRQQGHLSSSMADDSLFRLYIHFGEDYLKNKKRMKAIHVFIKAWGYKPFSMVPVKKTGKAILKG